MTRRHAEPNNILLSRNLPFDFDVRQRSHTLMMPVYCMWAKSNSRRRGRFEFDVTWSCFCFDFVLSHAWCDCCFIFCFPFQVVEIKQADCKKSTKNVNNYK